MAEIAARAAEILRAAGFGGPHACAVVTGTGLGRVAGMLEEPGALSYGEIPGFPQPGVTGHGGRLHRGRIAGRSVLVMEGRAHPYERGEAAAMRLPLTVLRMLGAQRLLLTNASGSLMPEAGPGSLVMLADHINLSGMNPLVGERDDARFVPMNAAYDPDLRARLARAAAARGLPLREGVYAWFSGPSFETPAEVRMAGRLGADLVGMSTVPEVILARFLGLPVAAVSVVTNWAAGIAGGAPHHAETQAAARAAADDLAGLIRAFVADFPETAPMTASIDAAVAARALPLLDLTDLGDASTEASVASLCRDARAGAVAAVCVWPRFVPVCRRALEGSPVRIATVVNFPEGGEDVEATVAETRATLRDGAQEIDLVLPYRALLRGDADTAQAMVAAVRAACGPACLKVILETGTLAEPGTVAAASRLALAAGADFIKTSTGKSPVSATPEAAETMLAAIRTSGRPAGLKVSGGLRSVADAATYLALADRLMGPGWASPTTMRLGASSLYGALKAAREAA